MVTTEAQTDAYYYGDDYFMKLPKGFFVVVADSNERIGRQSADVTINTNGDVRFGQKILTELSADIPPSGDLPSYIAVGSNGKDTLVFGFVDAEEADNYDNTYQFSADKKGFSGTGVLKSSRIDALVHLVKPDADPDSILYKWTETTDTGSKDVTKSLQVKTDDETGTTGNVTSISFKNPKIDVANLQVTITTSDMKYNVRSLREYSTPHKRHSAKIPVETEKEKGKLSVSKS